MIFDLDLIYGSTYSHFINIQSHMLQSMNNYNNGFQFRGDVDRGHNISIFILCVEMLATMI